MNARIFVKRDPDAQQPEDDIVKITYPSSSRYRLGDTPVTQEESASLGRQMNVGEIVGVPVWAYVHSGSTIKAAESNPFNCPWDSGRSGLAYMTFDDMVREAPEVAVADSDKKEWAEKYIKSVVEIFDAWLRGAVYGYTVEKEIIDPDSGEPLDDWEEVDSCRGFCGDDWRTNGIKDEVQTYLDQGAKVIEE